MALTLGIAKGRIIIDVDQVSQARAKIVQESNVMQDAFKKTGESADRAAQQGMSAFEKWGQKLSAFGQSMLGLSLIGGGISALGLKASGSLEMMNTRFIQLTGNAQKAAEVMSVIERRARAMGAPVVAAQQAFANILPNLDDGAKRADKWVSVMQRLIASSGGTQDFGGAAYSINEAITGIQSGQTDLISIADRFNLSKGKIKQALKETNNDLLAALDMVLNDLRLTDETAAAAGKTLEASMNKFGEAFKNAAGKGFAPFRDALQKIFDLGTNFLEWLQTSAPFVLNISVGFAAAAAAAGGFAIALGNVLGALDRLNKLGLGDGIKRLTEFFIQRKMGPLQEGENPYELSKAGRVAGVGLAAAAGVGVGIGVTNKIGEATGNEFLAKADIGTLISTIIKGLTALFTWIGGGFLQFAHDIIITGMQIGKVFNYIVEVVKTAGQLLGSVFEMIGGRVSEGIGMFVETLGKAIKFIGDLLNNDELKKSAEALVSKGGAMQVLGRADQETGNRHFFEGVAKLADLLSNPGEKVALTAADTQGIDEVTGKLQRNLADALTPLFEFADKIDTATKTTVSAPSAEVEGEKAKEQGKANAAQLEAYSKFLYDTQQLEKEADADRLKTTQDFEDQRKELEASTTKRRAREDREEKIRTDRAKAALDKQIAGMEKEAKAKEATDRIEIQKEYNESMTALNAQQQKEQRDHSKALLEIDREGRMSVLDAARKLNAPGVLDAEARWSAARSKEMGTGSEQEESAKKTAADRQAIEDRKKAREQELVDNRAALDTRIAEMRANFQQQQDEAAADKKRRRADEDEDQKEVIAKMQKARDERLTQIDNQLKAEKAKRDEAFVTEFNSLASANGAKLEVTRKYNSADLAELQDYLNKRNNMTRLANQGITPQVQQQAQSAVQVAQNIAANPVVSTITGALGLKPAAPQQPTGWGGVLTNVVSGISNLFGGFLGGHALGDPEITETGPYNLHKGEIVVSPASSAIIRAALGNRFTSAQLAGAVTGSGAGGSFSIGQLNMPLSFGDIGNYSKEYIQQIVGEEVVRRLGNLRGQYGG